MTVHAPSVRWTLARLSQVWSEFSVRPDEYIDAGDHVVVRGEIIIDTAKTVQALGQAVGAPGQPT